MLPILFLPMLFLPILLFLWLFSWLFLSKDSCWLFFSFSADFFHLFILAWWAFSRLLGEPSLDYSPRLSVRFLCRGGVVGAAGAASFFSSSCFPSSLISFYLASLYCWNIFAAVPVPAASTLGDLFSFGTAAGYAYFESSALFGFEALTEIFGLGLAACVPAAAEFLVAPLYICMTYFFLYSYLNY